MKRLQKKVFEGSLVGFIMSLLISDVGAGGNNYSAGKNILRKMP